MFTGYKKEGIFFRGQLDERLDLGEVPPLDEVAGHVPGCSAVDGCGEVAPGHAGHLSPIDVIWWRAKRDRGCTVGCFCVCERDRNWMMEVPGEAYLQRDGPVGPSPCG